MDETNNLEINQTLGSDTVHQHSVFYCVPIQPSAKNKPVEGAVYVIGHHPSFKSDVTLMELVTRLDSSKNISEHYAKLDTVRFTAITLEESWFKSLHLKFKAEGAHPDWLIVVYIVCLALFASIRIAGAGFLTRLFESLLSYNDWSKLYKLRNPQTSKLSFLFNLFFVLVYSLLAYHHCVASAYHIFGFQSVPLLAILFLSICLFFSSKYIVFKLFGFLSQEEELADKILHCIFSILKVSGIAILPIVIAQPYMGSLVGRYFILVAFAIMAISYLLLFIRCAQIFLYNKVSILYQIVYFCALELVPTLMVYKFMFSNIK